MLFSDTLDEAADAAALPRAFGDTRPLHFHPGVVDEILQRVCTGVMIAELRVVGDYSCSGILGAHHTADVNRLDVGKVREDPRAGCAGGLKATP